MAKTGGTAFSKLFVCLRTEAGFETAYQFFHGNGGRKVLQCTFSNYLRIEQGETLPHPRRLPILANLLRLPLKPQELRALAQAYLETWTESAEVADWFGHALRGAATGEPAPDPGRQALDKVVRQSVHPLSMKEYRAIIKDRASYWCYRALGASDAALSPEELSRKLGLSRRQIEAALAALREAGFARRDKDGSYRCPLAGKFHLFPDPSFLTPELIERPLKFNKEMADKNGGLLMLRHCGTRVDLDRFEGFLRFFREAVRTAQAYAPSDASARTGLVFVEGRVYKALDF